jgi:hypothetical protein
MTELLSEADVTLFNPDFSRSGILTQEYLSTPPVTPKGGQAHHWYSLRIDSACTIDLFERARRFIGSRSALFCGGQTSGLPTPAAGLKVGFPFAFTLVDVSVNAPGIFYMLDPTRVWFDWDEYLSAGTLLGTSVMFRPTQENEFLVFTDDSSEGTRVFLSSSAAEQGTANVEPNIDDREDWQVSVRNRLAELRGLPENWDDHNAERISPAILKYVPEILAEVMTSKAPPPQIVPTVHGLVQLEWHTKKDDLEIYLESPGRGSFFYVNVDRSVEQEGDIPEHLAELREIIRQLAR